MGKRALRDQLKNILNHFQGNAENLNECFVEIPNSLEQLFIKKLKSMNHMMENKQVFVLRDWEPDERLRIQIIQ